MFDLYNNAYGNYASDPYRHVRIETYGQDFGQTSWVTTEESNRDSATTWPESRFLRLGDRLRFGGICFASCGKTRLPDRGSGY